MNRLAIAASMMLALAPITGAGAQTTPPAPSVKKLADIIPEITIDTSTAPEMAGFARTVKALCEANYGRFAVYLTTDGYQPPTKFTIVFPKGWDGIAETSGTRIKCAPWYFTANPKDYGAVLHEMVHVIQQYRGGAPVWLTEGITDYVRFYMYEPVSNRPHPNPDKAKYTDSYRVTACFLDWINRTYDKSFVQKMNVVCRKGTYSSNTWTDLTGKDVNALWGEFTTWLRTHPDGSAGGQRLTLRTKTQGAPKTK